MIERMFRDDLASVVEGARALAGADLSGLDDDSLMPAAVELAYALHALETALAHVAGELDVGETCVREHGLVARTWLAHQTDCPRARAARFTQTGRELRLLPAVDAALVDGQIGFDHAAHLARQCTGRVRARIEDVQDELVAWAQ